MNPGNSSVATQPLPNTTDAAIGVRANIVLKTLKGVSIIDGMASAAHSVITLRGRVRTSAERARAGLAVASIDGVQGVRNLLELERVGTSPPNGETHGPGSVESDPPLPDQTIKERLEAALRADNSRKLAGVKVTDVNHGVVHMTGRDVTMSGRWRAVELAWNAAGSAPEDGTPPQA